MQRTRFEDDLVKLPNGERADLGTKLEDYVLNPSHPGGRHKSRVFDSVLGITLANADILRRALLTAAVSSAHDLLYRLIDDR